jgi:hypothetical protein
MPMEIRYGTRRFPVRAIHNSGKGNNCLGYALGSMLKCEPSELRASLCEFVRCCPDPEMQADLACSVLEALDDVPESDRVEAAARALERGCFIPADVFVAYCAKGKDRRRTLLKHNVIFFAERDDHYEPVTFYLDHVSQITHYVGCDNTHYEALALSPRHQLQFDVLFFGV